MLTRVLLALGLVALAYSYEHSYENKDRDPSEFCRGYPCPTYTVVEKKQVSDPKMQLKFNYIEGIYVYFQEYELREYEELIWARTGGNQTVFGWWLDLFWYFHRSNSRRKTQLME